jgi:hypothetical protein
MKRSLITIVVAATAAVLAAIAVSQAAPPPGSSSKRARSTLVSPAHGSLGSRFSVLRSAKVATSSSAAALPASTVKRLTKLGTLVSEFELEPTNAVPVEIGTTQAWVIPGRSGICLAVSGALVVTEDCGPLASANARGLVMVVWPQSGPAIIYGLVPDGASVAVTNTDGSTSNVPVTSNVFMHADSSAQSVSVQPVGGPAMTTAINTAEN